MSASAIVATVSDAREFTRARQFAAWLGLVPRQYSTAGKARLGHIIKRGDAYLRTLLILGARSALRTASKRADVTNDRASTSALGASSWVWCRSCRSHVMLEWIGGSFSSIRA